MKSFCSCIHCIKVDTTYSIVSKKWNGCLSALVVCQLWTLAEKSSLAVFTTFISHHLNQVLHFLQAANTTELAALWLFSVMLKGLKSLIWVVNICCFQDVCSNLWCQVDSRCSTHLEAAAEGTICGNNKVSMARTLKPWY